VKLLLDGKPSEVAEFLNNPLIQRLQIMSEQIDTLVASEAAQDTVNAQLIEAVTTLVPAVQTLVQNNTDLKTALEQALAGAALSEADKAAVQAIIDQNNADMASAQAALALLTPLAQAVSDANVIATPAA
jgi:ribosomal protein S20